MTNVVEGQERSPVEERLRAYYRQEASVTPPDLWSRLAHRLASDGTTHRTVRPRARLLTHALVPAIAAAATVAALLLWWPGGGTVDTVSAGEVVEHMREAYGVTAQQRGVEGDVVLDLGNLQVYQTTDPETGHITTIGVVESVDGTVNADSIAALVAQVGNGFEVNLAEKEELDGVEHYVLVLTPGENSPLPPDTEIRLWVNPDTYLVSRMTLSSPSGGFSFSSGSDLEDLSDLKELPGMHHQDWHQVTP